MNTKLIAQFQRKIDDAQNKLDKFKADFDKDPAYALSWSNGVFRHAAELQLFRQVLTALEGDASLAEITESLTSRVMHKSRYPAQSTSPTSNLMEQYELSVAAELLGDLQYQRS
jgi:hypothetical protein